MASVPPERHLLRARDLADARYAEPLTVAGLARAAGLSRAHVSQEFRRALGEPPHAYPLTRRQERAAAPLRTTGRPVAEISPPVRHRLRLPRPRTLGSRTEVAMDDDALGRLREICLALPEAVEKPFGGHTAPTFRVRDKMFAMTTEDGGATWLKAGPGVQEALVSSAPERYFVPPYVGPKGWVGVHLDAVADWDELTELVEESYRLIAPKRLTARLDDR